MGQHRDHGGHGHSHHHHHDNTYLTSKNKKDAGVRITRIGLLVNCIMAISKGAGGYLLNSQSLLADAAHSLTDLVSDVLTLGTVAWAIQPPTERFPSGYGKIESLGSLGVSGLLLAGGLGLGWHSCEILYNMWFPALDVLDAVGDHAGHVHAHDHGHIHSHGGSLFGHGHSHNLADMGIPNVHAAWIAAASILVKEYLYRATIKIARERKSSVLASNAVHHRIDSLTSIVALTAILGSNMFTNIAWLDPVGGLLVSLMVIRAGWANTGNAARELADISIDDEMKETIQNAASKSLVSQETVTNSLAGQKIEIREVSGIKAGQNYLVEIKLGVPDTTSLRETSSVETKVREDLGASVRGLRRLRIKFVANSDSLPDLPSEFIAADQSASEDPESQKAHEHSHAHPVEDGKKRR